MAQKQSQTSSPTAEAILKGIAKGIWKGNEGEPPIPTPNDIKRYETVQISHDRKSGFNLDTIRDMYPVQVRQMFGVEGPIYQTPEISDALDAVQDEWENTGATTAGEIEDRHPDLWKKHNTLWGAKVFFDFGVFLIESLEERIVAIHQTWLELREVDVNIPHPLSTIIRAWLHEQIPKVEPERRTDTGIIHHAVRDTFPSPRLNLKVIEELPGKPEQTKLFTSLPQGDLQMELPGFVFPESEIVPALPLVAYENAGGKIKRKGRGAPIEQRLFVNVLIEYEQRLRTMFNTSRLNTTYRDVKSWLYPTGTKEPRETLIPKLYKGMWYLHNLRFVWDRREWNIISVDSLPTPAIRPDDALTFTVRMPDGMNTKNGALIGIEPLRIYGAKSAPKFRAWVRLAYLWDAAKIRNGGKRIYATVPEVIRNADGYLVNAKGEVILTGDLHHTKAGWKVRNGSQPQMAWYHPLAIKTGGEVRNSQADKVPILSDSDMVNLFYDHSERKGTDFTSCLQLARKHGLEMQDDGRVVVETNQVNEKTGIKGLAYP